MAQTDFRTPLIGAAKSCLPIYT